MNVMLSTKKAAAYLGSTESTLRKWRLTGYGPRYFKLAANRAVYAPSDLDAWLAERAFFSTAEETAKRI
jgi:predicted DNA-binding transcriptional regulator AlpA